MRLQYEAPITTATLDATIDRDGIYAKAASGTDNLRHEGTTINLRGGRSGIIGDMNVPYKNWVIKDVLINVQRGANSITKWGIRRHNLVDPRTERVRVVDFTRPNNANLMMEHAIYDEVASGMAIYSLCSAANIPAQFIQIRLAGNRQDPKWKNERTILISDCTAEEIGQLRGAGRAAFAVSVKDSGPNATVSIDNLQLQTIRQSNVAKRSDGTYADSFAAVCIEYCHSFHWEGGFINYKNPRTDAVQLFDFANKAEGQTGPENIHISNVTFGPANHIALRLDKTTKSVSISNCQGDGDIKIYKQGADNIYRISSRTPISQGFSFST
jgi:hypothetical protein